MKRRHFFGVSAAASAAGSSAAPTQLREPARDIPVAGEFDVIVAGGGPAGSSAAIAAARAGARTLLLESQGSIGGVWTSGIMTELSDTRNKKGVVTEILSSLRKRGGLTGGAYGTFDPEIMKLVLDTLCREASVEVRLHTMVAGAVKNAAGRLTHAITESKSGREAWAAKCFVDSSGDGDLAARAGCGFDFGHPETKEFQPFSLRCVVAGIGSMEGPIFDEHRVQPSPLWKEIQRGGVEPSYLKSNFFPIRPGVAALMANHEYGFRPTDAAAVTRATLAARDELHRIVAALRSLGGNWKDVWLASTGEMIGMRESRRIHGLYTITVEDAARGARFDDAVCRATYGIDIHSGNPKANKGIVRHGIRMQPFDIPLRALIARDVTALLMAGRCISGDHYAHGCYRISGNAAATGEAAGRTAALAALSGRLPQQVRFAELRLPPIDDLT
jgi:hypothetical protein